MRVTHVGDVKRSKSAMWVMAGVLIGLTVAAPPVSAAVTSLPALSAIVVDAGTPITAVPTMGPADLAVLTAPISWAISPTLPSGLLFDSSTGVISGTPQTATPSATYTASASDATSTLTVAVPITVNGVVTPPGPIAAFIGVPISGAVFATIGLTAPPSFTLDVAAPSWLGIAVNGAVVGTPTSALAQTSFPVTVTDANGVTVTSSLTVSSGASLTPSTQALAGVTGTAVSGTLPFATAPTGTGYRVSPDLATLTGLTLDPATGAISGTPTHPIAATNFTVQLVDTATSSVQGQAIVTVTIDGILGTTPQAINGTVGTTISGFAGYSAATAVAAGLKAPIVFSTTPALPGVALPGDLTISATTGAITGRPGTASTGTKYTVIATDANGARATGPVTVSVVGLVLPAAQSLLASIATPTTSRALTATGMTAPITYTIDPVLPAGLVLNSATGVVSGTPRGLLPVTTYTITAGDASGAKGTAKLSITVDKTPLTAPIISSVVGGTTPGSLVVYFTAPSLAPTGQTYTINVYDSLGASVLTTVDATKSPVTVAGLTPGESYLVTVVANATSTFDRVESQGKLGIAAAGLAQSSVTVAGPVVATPSTVPAPGTVSPSVALSRAGFVLADRSQAKSAKKMRMTAPPSKLLSGAPTVRIRTSTYYRISLIGVSFKGVSALRLRAGGQWLVLGSAKAKQKGKDKGLLRLPAFAATKSGTYPIQVVGATGTSLYVSLVVS